MRSRVMQAVYFLLSHRFGLVVPGIAYKSQYLSHLLVTQFKHKRRHAKGLLVGSCHCCKAAMQYALDQVAAGSQLHGPVARQGRVGA